MDLQILTLCDFAEDFGGKMCITGTFDTLRVAGFPANSSTFSIAARIAFDQGEVGRQEFSLAIKDERGRPIVPELNGNFDIPERHSFLGATNLVLTLNGFRFPLAGIYFVGLSVNGEHLKSIAFKVEQAQRPA